MKITKLTFLGFMLARVIEESPTPGLTFRQIFHAADEYRLLPLLQEHYGTLTDIEAVTLPGTNVAQLEAALRDGAAVFDGRSGDSEDPASCLRLLIEIVLETIQQQFSPEKIANRAYSLAFYNGV